MIFCEECKAETLNDRFCSRSCSAKFTNRTSPKRSRLAVRTCDACSNQFKRSSKARGNTCEKCRSKARKERARIRNNRLICDTHIDGKSDWMSRKDVRNDCARRNKHRPNVCQACGHDRIVENAHIVPIASYPPSAKLSLVNGPSNVYKLCPTCHALFDSKNPEWRAEIQSKILTR